MFKNYILTSIRNLRKKIGFTIVNVIGLSIGLTTCLLIYLFVNYDLSYDSFQSDNVYRIWLNRVYPEREVNYVFIPHSMGPQMVTDFPEVENQARLFFPGNTVDYRYKDKMFTEGGLMFADSTIFSVLKINVLKGNPEDALNEESSIAISQKIALKVFGDEEPIWQNS